MWSMCCCCRSHGMERLNSWNSIIQTFSPYSKTDSARIQTKRRKITPKRKTVSFSIQKAVSTRLEHLDTSNIEDSDEENVKFNESEISPPHSKSKRSKFVPLITSRMCTPCQPTKEIHPSDSEDVIAASGDVCDGIANANSSRWKNDGRQNGNSSFHNAKVKIKNSIKDDLITIKNVFNGNRVANEQATLEDSIIDTDTDDEDDAAERSTHATTTAMPLNVHLDSQKSILVRPSSEPTIDSVSSFGSFQCQSQTQIEPAQKSQKRPKVMKGGLGDTLQRAIRKAKSDHAFWLNERQSTLTAPGECVIVKKIERSFGRVLVHCGPLDDSDGDVKVFCVDPDSKKLRFLDVGKTIEVDFNTNGYQLDSRTLCFANVNHFLTN